MIIGFNWGGWVLGKTAENNATMLVNTALVKAYGPVCIERFKQQPNVEAKWAELTKVDTWRRESYIKDSGFATPPGSALPNAAIADACADALSKIISMQTPGRQVAYMICSSCSLPTQGEDLRAQDLRIVAAVECRRTCATSTVADRVIRTTSKVAPFQSGWLTLMETRT
jgi:hypothetical protein